MDILPMRDLIQDEYGNYYTVIKEGNKEITLVNAFMELSFRRILMFNEDFKREFEKYEKKYMGQQAMDVLKNIIKLLEERKTPGKIYSLNDIKKEYEKIHFIPLYEKECSINR